MILTIFLVLILVIMASGLLKLYCYIRELKQTIYYQGLALLGTFDDAGGFYSCLDSETAVSIGIYLVTLGRDERG